VRNLLRDPRVAFSVQTFEEPYPAVMMRGDATVATANDAAMIEQIRAITRRYLVPEEVEGYIARWPDLRTIVTIVPAHIVSWSAGG
jgi:hypothetical protein